MFVKLNILDDDLLERINNHCGTKLDKNTVFYHDDMMVYGSVLRYLKSEDMSTLKYVQLLYRNERVLYATDYLNHYIIAAVAECLHNNDSKLNVSYNYVLEIFLDDNDNMELAKNLSVNDNFVP